MAKDKERWGLGLYDSYVELYTDTKDPPKPKIHLHLLHYGLLLGTLNSITSYHSLASKQTITPKSNGTQYPGHSQRQHDH